MDEKRKETGGAMLNPSTESVTRNATVICDGKNFGLACLYSVSECSDSVEAFGEILSDSDVMRLTGRVLGTVVPTCWEP